MDEEREIRELTDEEIGDLMIGEEQKDLLELLDRMDSEDAWQLDKVVIPEELDGQDGYCGPLFGFIRERSGYHAVLGWADRMPPKELGAEAVGYVSPERNPGDSEALIRLAAQEGRHSFLVGEWGEEGLGFTLREILDGSHLLDGGRSLEKDVYTMKQNLFSRNSGLMETSWMDDKCVVLSGCGSVGSCVALQLARSGVGRFILIDTDCVEIHNICRHQCSLTDIGRYKAEAVRDRILQINPEAQVECLIRKIQEVPLPFGPKGWLAPDRAIFIGTCDNRVGNAFACDAACEMGIPFASLGFMERAWGGEIFTCLPEKQEICYRCAFHAQIERSIEEERRNHFYLGEEEKEKAHFEPGLDVDIEYGVAILDKIVLDILNRANGQYHPRLYHTLSQFTVFSGTDDKEQTDPFWRKALPRALDLRGVRLTDRMRRCSYCTAGRTEHS